MKINLRICLPSFLLALIFIGLLSCCNKTTSTSVQTAPGLTGSDVSFLPKAIVYRTTDNCSDLVPVTLTPDGRSILTYPAPTDLTAQSQPIQLADGWWLDRRGISADSHFTDYTYQEYRSLAKAPSPQELMSHLNASCRISTIAQLPMSLNEALADTAAVNKLLITQPERLKTLFSLPVFRIE